MIVETITCLSLAANVAWALNVWKHKRDRDKVRAYARHPTMLPPAPCAAGCKACGLARQHPTMFKCDRAARIAEARIAPQTDAVRVTGASAARVSEVMREHTWTTAARCASEADRAKRLKLLSEPSPERHETQLPPVWRKTWRDAFAAYEAERKDQDKTPTEDR